MKRLIAAVMALMMLCTCAMAESYDGLTEKARLQMERGSGLKGSFTLTAEGEGEWLAAAKALNGADIQVRNIRNGSVYECLLYVAQGENQLAETTLYIGDDYATLTSALLPEVAVQLQAGEQLMHMLFSGDVAESVPTWYSGALNIAGVDKTVWVNEWEKALAPYMNDLEVWMLSYSATPEMTEEDGHTIMHMRYDIPAEAVKAQIISMIEKMTADETLKALMAAQLTEEQLATYFSAQMVPFYKAAVNLLPLQGSIVMERAITTLGENLSASITLPLPPSKAGWKTLRIAEENNTVTCTAAGEDRNVQLSWQNNPEGTNEVIWRDIPAEPTEENKATSLRIALNKMSEKTQDEDGRAHEKIDWTLEIADDLSHLDADDATCAYYAVTDPLKVTLALHMSSKNSNSSPTTIEISASVTKPDGVLTVAGQLKTSSPWVVGAANVPADALDLMTMDSDALSKLAEDYVAALAKALSVQ